MKDIRIDLGNGITIESCIRENWLMISRDAPLMSMMLPLNQRHDCSFFEESESLVIARAGEWSFVQVKAGLDKVKFLTESLGYPLDVIKKQSA